MKRKSNPFKIGSYCFEKQREFILDESRFKTAVCSRRAGKTVACAADLIETAISNAKVTCLYITLSRSNAKKIIWRNILEINEEFKLGGTPNETDLSMRFANKSIIYLSGAKDATEIEKFRGLALKKVYIDETQSFRSYLMPLINDVIVPALFDHKGTLILIGTPGPICAGPFYDAAHSDAWSNHHWTMIDNPHIEIKSGMKVEDILREERKRRGIKETDPSYRRENLGEWVQDLDSLVYKYNKDINDFDKLPDGFHWNYIFGIDLGLDDADAIAVLAYSPHHPHVFLVDEFVQNGLDVSSLAEQIKIMEKRYKPVKMVIDHGGLGKKVAEELRKRHQLPIVAAEKTRKFEFIELLNDDLRTGRLKMREKSQCAEEYFLITWDRRGEDGMKVSDTFHSDIADAVLYAWREAYHFASEEKIEKPKPHEERYIDEHFDRMASKIDKKKGMEYWEKDFEDYDD